jgi:hypothetical protein
MSDVLLMRDEGYDRYGPYLDDKVGITVSSTH